MSKEEAMRTGHELDIYVDSEMSDEKTGKLDELWQSIYDLVQVATYGIVEEDEEGDFAEELEDIEDGDLDG